MKLLTAALLAATSAAAQTPSLAGRWQVHLSVSGYEADIDCTLRHEDGTITGRCTSDNGTVEVKGRTDGRKVEWSFTSETGGEKHDVLLKGVVESETKMKGSVEVPAYGVEGEFTAAKKQ